MSNSLDTLFLRSNFADKIVMNKVLKTNFGNAASCLDVDQYYTEEWQSVLAGRVECFDHCERQKRNATSCLDVDQYYTEEWQSGRMRRS